MEIKEEIGLSECPSEKAEDTFVIEKNDNNDNCEIYVDLKNQKKIFSFVKRSFDIVVSATALVVAAIPMAVVAGAVWSTTKGPILFRQPRVGRDGKLFNCLKFRTMYITAPKSVATSELRDATSQITWIGKLLRKTSLDELPQFINILRGDMSLVGPRPLIPDEFEIHDLRQKYGVYNIRPGITGWAQINGRDKVTATEKALLDRYYYENRSVGLDLKILFLTVPKVLFGKDIVEGKISKEEKNQNKKSR